MRAAIYARISDDAGGLELGVTDQLVDCRARCVEEGWEFEAWSDNDIGAFRRKHRPGWTAMLEALDTGRFGIVLATYPERFARNVHDFADLLDVAERRKVKIVTLRAEHWDLSTAAGRKHVRQAISDAVYEADRTGERVSRARLREATAGKPNLGGKYRPWGFAEDRIAHHPTEAAEVRDAARRLLAGESLRSVAKRYDRYPAGVKRALSSPRAAGFRQYKGQTFPAVWEPILDVDTWEGVKAVLANRGDSRTEPGGTVARKYLLTGFLRCGLEGCGARVQGGTLTLRGKGRVTGYRCAGCGNVRRTAEPLERYVIDQLLRRHPVESPSSDVVDPALANRVHGFTARIAEALEMWKAGTLSASEYAAAKVDLESRLAEAQTDLAEAQEAGTPDSYYGAYLDEGGDVILPHGLGASAVSRSAWDSMDLRQQRATLARHIARIVLHRARRGRRFDTAAVEIIGLDGRRWA